MRIDRKIVELTADFVKIVLYNNITLGCSRPIPITPLKNISRYVDPERVSRISKIEIDGKIEIENLTSKSNIERRTHQNIVIRKF